MSDLTVQNMRKFKKELQKHIVKEPLFVHRQYSGAISVNANFAKNTEFMQAMKGVQNCIEHHGNYAFGDDHYRLYKRGKNRCKRCGVRT